MIFRKFLPVPDIVQAHMFQLSNCSVQLINRQNFQDSTRAALAVTMINKQTTATPRTPWRLSRGLQGPTAHDNPTAYVGRPN